MHIKKDTHNNVCIDTPGKLKIWPPGLCLIARMEEQLKTGNALKTQNGGQ